MKTKELREMSIAELEKLLEQKKAEAVRLRFEISSKQLKNNREYRKTKKDVARIITILNEAGKKK